MQDKSAGVGVSAGRKTPRKKCKKLCKLIVDAVTLH